jgi:hypothetical protein
MAAKTSNPIGKGAVDALGAAQVGLAEISSYELAPDSRPRVCDDLVEPALTERLQQVSDAIDVLKRAEAAGEEES